MTGKVNHCGKLIWSGPTSCIRMQGSVVIQRTRAAALSGPFKKIELGTRSLLSDLSMAPGIRRPTDEPSVDLMRSGSFEPKAGRCVIDGRMSLAAGPRAWLVDGMGVMFANHDKRPDFPTSRARPPSLDGRPVFICSWIWPAIPFDMWLMCEPDRVGHPIR